jgi:hypothetical protein
MISLRIFTAITFALLLSLSSVSAAPKASKVTDLPGSAYVVRCNPEGTWVATWAANENTKDYTLWAVDTAKGDKFEVDKSKDPGGMCWVPNRNMLFYCSAKAVSFESGVKYNAVTYYTWDVTNKKRSRVSELKDDLKTYIIDPVPAEDGSRVFHLTITGNKPSFNTYFPSGKPPMMPMLVNAKVAADYDLSADGQTVYWPMSEESGKLVITGWGFKKNFYSGMYQINKDPASARAGFKVDSVNKQAVTMAQNASDPALKAAVYSFKDPKNPVAIPVKLDPAEEIVMQDWKGRSGQLYMVVVRQVGQKNLYSIIEVNPANGNRTAVLPDATDEIRFVDYASRSGNYFFSAVTDKGTRIVKL